MTLFVTQFWALWTQFVTSRLPSRAGQPGTLLAIASIMTRLEMTRVTRETLNRWTGKGRKPTRTGHAEFIVVDGILVRVIVGQKAGK